MSADKVLRAKERAKIAKRTRQLEKKLSVVVAAERSRAKCVPADWLPAENINARIHTKKTLTDLFARAWAADLVNLTDCYGNNAKGCDPNVCSRSCSPTVVEPAPNKVFFFAGVGPTSEYRRIFQDGGSANWTFVSSVVPDSKENYFYKRHVGKAGCAGMRRAVVHFRDSATSQLVWAVIYLHKKAQLPGRRILTYVGADEWLKSAESLVRAGVARRRPTHGPFDPNSLEPGSVYLLPTDFAFDKSYMPAPSNDQGVSYVKAAGAPNDLRLTVQQVVCGNRTVVRIGRLCPAACDNIPRSAAEHLRHAISGCRV